MNTGTAAVLRRAFELIDAQHMELEFDDMPTGVDGLSFPDGHIIIDLRKCGTLDGLLRVLLHEIGHVMTGAFYGGKPAADSWAAAERAADSWAKQFLDSCGGCVV